MVLWSCQFWYKQCTWAGLVSNSPMGPFLQISISIYTYIHHSCGLSQPELEERQRSCTTMSSFYNLENPSSGVVACVSQAIGKSTVDNGIRLGVFVLGPSSVLHALCTDTPICTRTGTEEQCVFTHILWVQGGLTERVQVSGLLSQVCCEPLLWPGPVSDCGCHILHLYMVLPHAGESFQTMCHQLHHPFPSQLSQEGSFYDSPTYCLIQGDPRPSKMQQPTQGLWLWPWLPTS